MELDEKKYLYLLYTATFGASFCIIYIEKKTEFGDLEMVKKLSPESSVFKPVLKLEYCFWR
jgi:Ca-activated chloride channel family protein